MIPVNFNIITTISWKVKSMQNSKTVIGAAFKIKVMVAMFTLNSTKASNKLANG